MTTAPVDMDGGKFDILAATGYDVDFSVLYQHPDGTAYDLTGWTAHMAIRVGPADPVLLLVTTATSPSYLAITAATGQVQIHVDHASTVSWQARGYAFDVRLIGPSNQQVRLLYGTLTLRPLVTPSV